MSKNEVIVINDVDVQFNLVNDEFSVTSLDIAKVFEKQHTHVIRSIENMGRFEILKDQSKIGEIFYSDKYGRKQKVYQLNRDVFGFIVMGFTGKKAEDWKWDFINVFNEMERLIRVDIKKLQEKDDQLKEKEALIEKQAKLLLYIAPTINSWEINERGEVKDTIIRAYARYNTARDVDKKLESACRTKQVKDTVGDLTGQEDKPIRHLTDTEKYLQLKGKTQKALF